MNILIIGSTGFIGRELVKQLADKNFNLTLLVRNKEKASTLKELNPTKIQLIKGDLTLPNLGLNTPDKKTVLTCDTIIHCGGPMDITLTKEEAKEAFLNGAKSIGELAIEIHRKHEFNQFIHVVGYMSPFTDKQTDWQSHNVFEEMHPQLINDSFYEQMKFQADILIRQIALKENFPITTINPPTVIGNKETGKTEQLDGFGLFIKIIRQGLLPVVPGGSDYRLPVIHNDIFAEFVIQTLFQPPKKSATYTLVTDKHNDLTVPQLMTLVTNSMYMNTPKIVLPMPLLKSVMTFGGSQLTGIPKSGLNFMTNREFDNNQVKTDFSTTLVESLSDTSSLPLVVADIDHTLTFGKTNTEPFVRKSINQTSYYYLEGKGKAIVLIHGLFSEATDLFALGIELHNQTNRPIWLIDLPGCGRSPFKPHQDVLIPYLEVIKNIQSETNAEATFIGHSFGAALILKAIENKVLSTNQKVVLLQLPVNKMKTDSPIWLSKVLLKTASIKRLNKYFMHQGLFSFDEEISGTYFKHLKKSFSSPRILNTNLLLNKYLSKMTFDKPKNKLISSIWGVADTAYNQPNIIKNGKTLPFGHHFPISQPEKTANSILELL